MLIIGIDREIYLDCRRSEQNKKLYIGKLGPTSKAIASKISSPQRESIPAISEVKTEAPKIIIPQLGDNKGLNLPPLPALNIKDLQQSLGELSQKVAPKIKHKEKESSTKETTYLNFQMY